jgi:hypothetical protein
MRSAFARTAVAVAASAVVTGCITPWNTRLPTLDPGIPAVERRMYEIHDPYPEQDLGPDTQTRPRYFEEPRSQPRRLLEGRMLRDLGPSGVPTTPAVPPSAAQYPDSVQP